MRTCLTCTFQCLGIIGDLRAPGCTVLATVAHSVNVTCKKYGSTTETAPWIISFFIFVENGFK